MALLQTQMDVGVAAWGTLKTIRSLIRAASVDDVQPHTITAMASLGSKMNIDQRLILVANEALGGDQNVKLEQLKLSIGLASGGIASEIKKSPAAIKTFLLITSLSIFLSQQYISELLVEMLLQSKIIEETVVSSSQLLKLINSFGGNSHVLLRDGQIPQEALEAIKAITAKEHEVAPDYFEPVSPADLADILLEVFDAVRDQEIGRLQIKGQRGAVTIVTTLVWLFRDDVEVRTLDGEIFVHSRKLPAKISVILDCTLSHHQWTKEVWYSVDTTDLLNGQPNHANEVQYNGNGQLFATLSKEPARAPCSLFYTLWQVHAQNVDFSGVANWSLALVRAVLRGSKIERDDIAGSQTSQSVAFEDICSPEFLATYMRFPVLLGCPESMIDPELIQTLGDRFLAKTFDYPLEAGPKYWHTHTWFGSITREFCMKDVVSTPPGTALNDTAWKLALIIADLALLSATRADLIDSLVTLPLQIADRERDECDTLVLQLLNRDRKIKGSIFLQKALLAAHGPCAATPPSSLIALSGFGRVCYLSAFLFAPTQVRDAFRINVQPGQLRWRNAPIYFIGDEQLRFVPIPATNPATLTINSETDSHPASLRVRDYRPFQYFLTPGIHENSAHLVCERQYYTDSRSLFTKSLINWATAMRARPTGRTKEEQLARLEKEEVVGLQLKHQACAALHCFMGGFDLEGMRAVSCYNEREKMRFLEFGTQDTCILHCIVQNGSRLTDCIIQAIEVYGSNWVIMANPSTGYI